MKEVVIIGAGFSGMSAAYYLSCAGFSVEVVEMQKDPGGLIRTVETPWGQCETAAPGILNSKLFEELAQKIGLKLVSARKLSRRRYIYREYPRRWPLSLSETLSLFLRFIFSKKRSPKPQESILHWGQRVIGMTPTQYLLNPALQGIYAGDVSQLSASLILNRFFKRSRRLKPKVQGLVSPEGGMKELFLKAEEFLKSKGVKFNYNKCIEIGLKQNKIYVVATSARGAGELLTPVQPKIALALRSMDTLSLVKMTAFYKDQKEKLRGYGILFPRDQKFKALGILFNNFIFGAKNSSFLSESFIFGGVFDGEISQLSDQAILNLAQADRARLYGFENEPVGYHVQRWPETLPHYTIDLEKKLKSLEPDLNKLERDGVFVIGNFRGAIGLSQILERASMLPERIKTFHG